MLASLADMISKRQIDIESCIRANLVTPDRADQWLAKLLASAGRELGALPDGVVLPRLLGILLANLPGPDAEAIRELFFRQQ